MTEAEAVFTTVSSMMFANGAVLAVVSRDLPVPLRPAAMYWQLGTILIALGCAVFAFGTPLSRPIMLLGGNCPMVLGLTAYHAAVQKFDGIRPGGRQLLPTVLAIACVVWFSIVNPDFRMRVAVVSAIWAWLMFACIVTLLGNSRGDTSLSRKILIGIFAVVMVYVVVRIIVYLGMGVSADFAVESGKDWLNLLSPIFMTFLPVVGTTAFLLMCSDNLRRQLETAASTDYLTGLPNRRTLARNGVERFKKAGERGIGFAVAVLDLDNFKTIDDSHGHDVGDQALVHVADHLLKHTRRGDMIARAGGEEFAVLLNGLDRVEAVAAVERMRIAIEDAQFRTGPVTIPITLSAGVAVYRSGDATFEDMVRRADQALYAAKSGGRNRIEIAQGLLAHSYDPQ